MLKIIGSRNIFFMEGCTVTVVCRRRKTFYRRYIKHRFKSLNEHSQPASQSSVDMTLDFAFDLMALGKENACLILGALGMSVCPERRKDQSKT